MRSGYDKFFKEAKEQGKSGKAKVKMKASAKPMRKRSLMARRKKAKPPILSLSFMALGLAAAICGLFYIDELDQTLGSVEISGFSSAVAAGENESSKEKAAETKEKKEEKVAEAQTAQNKSRKEMVAEWNEKDLSFLNKLSARKEELDHREKELEAMEQELQRQKAVLDNKIANLTKIRDEISKILKNRIDMDEEKINKLVEFYSNMKPQQAAQVFTEINEKLAVEVLGRMKKQNAAAIMNLLKPDKAQVLSEKFAGYREPASE